MDELFKLEIKYTQYILYIYINIYIYIYIFKTGKPLF